MVLITKWGILPTFLLAFVAFIEFYLKKFYSSCSSNVPVFAPCVKYAALDLSLFVNAVDAEHLG